MLLIINRFLDAQGGWMRKSFTPERQVRLGVAMTDLGLVLCLAVFFFPDKPPLIFGALALLFGGISTAITARAALADADDLPEP